MTSAEGSGPVVGAQVWLVGTQRRAMTGDDGRYSLTAPAGTYRMRVTRIGFAPDSATSVTVVAGSATTVNFQLRQAATVLGEVVTIVPYGGEQSGREVTGSVASVGPAQFNTGRVVGPQELITGKVAGVQVVDNNEPGGGLAVRIRGGTSISASNEPLYVVDGVPLQIGGGASSGRNPLNFINPNDIENVTVLKDASATAIYGSRGANGVVLITTRAGLSGPQFTYTGSISTSEVTGGPDMMGAAEYRAAVAQYAPQNVSVLGSASTDWVGAIQRNGGGYEHNLGINGRRESLNYFLGLNYLDNEGVLQGTRTQRTAATINYGDRLLRDRLALRTHLKASRIRDWYTPGGVLGSAIAFAPTQPIRTPTGAFYEYPSSLGANNPIAELSLVQDAGTVQRFVGSLQGEYTLPWISGLTATVRGSYDGIQAERTSFLPSTLQSQIESGGLRGNISRDLPEQVNTVLDAFARYETRFEPFASTFNATAGFSSERFRGDYASFYAQGLSTDLLGPSGVPAAIETRPFYSVDETILRSGFGRLNLTMAERYLFTLTVRRDGSSKFAEGRQWGTFPSAAFAWRAIEEPFVRERLPFSDLKLRLSWGVNGNQSVGNYLAYTSYLVGQSTAQAQFGNQFVTTIRPSGSDPNLRWEETRSTNAGLDWGILEDRFTGTIDIYSKRTTDLLFSVPTAAGTALSNFVTTNIGTVTNRGLELGVNARVIDGGARGFGWDASFVASTNRNRLESIDRPGIQRVLTGGIAGGVGSLIQVLQPGQPINSFFVYQHRMENGKPINRDVNNSGAIDEQDLYVDLNGDGIINQSDRRPFHSPAPDWILGHSSNLRWNGFDASATFRAYLGNYVYNNLASNLGNYSVLQLAGAPTNLHVSAREYGFTRPQYLSDIYVEEASFLRMDNLTVGYTFGALRGLDRPRLFGTIQNVFTATGYSGVDPTAGVNGIDNTIYPRSRTWVLGASVNF